MTELVDILLPPNFMKSGIVKTRTQAIGDGDWLGTFNLWIVKQNPVPSIVYQLRSPKTNLFPNKLDVAVGGHYTAGESIEDGLREVKEEIGKDYLFDELKYLGQKIFVGPDIEKRMRHYIIDVFFTKDESPLSTYKLQAAELGGIFECPIILLKELYEAKRKVFEVEGLNLQGEKKVLEVRIDSFPFNWDFYHRKMVYLAEKFLSNEKNLFY